jgi:type IV pilus assembly protein PilB
MPAALQIHLPGLAGAPVQLGYLDDAQFQTGLVVSLVVIEADKLVAAIAQLAEAPEKSLKSFTDDALGMELDVTETEAEADEQAALEVDDAPVVRFIQKILIDAINEDASASTR